MKYSQGAFRTSREAKEAFESRSHELLIRAGFIDQVGSGIYSYLPLAKRVLSKIEAIVREEMNKIGGLEIAMPSLHPKSLWETTNRWDAVDVLFKIKSQYGQEFGLGPTHEEIVTPLAQKFIQSYRDLPLYLYQIAPKFRDEPRPKSGILRGREFGMKDMYSFHKDQKDLLEFYDTVIEAYKKIFLRCGLSDVKITEASGGSFTKKHSHEFNVITNAGEVDLIYCTACDFAQNDEVFSKKNRDICPVCGGKLAVSRAIEIGNIFDLGTRFSKDFQLAFTDEEGKRHDVIMGCYGIGTTRLIGAIVEVCNDEKGMAWPKEVAPAQVHLINLVRDSRSYADLVYRTLSAEKIEVLYDDRSDISAGEKFADCDLIGVPIRLVVSDRTEKNIEWKERGDTKAKLLDIQALMQEIKEYYQ